MTSHLFRVLFVGLGLGALPANAPPADAQSAVDVSTYPWSSIAKVNNDAGGSCTGAVIAPDEVLTAAHCVLDRRKGRRLPPSSLHVLLGYEGGDYAKQAKVVRYTIGPGYDPKKKLETLPADWIVLTLTKPLPGAIKPLPLCEGPVPETARLSMASFARGRRHVLTADEDCKLLRQSENRLLFENDCKGAQGSSGAPILVSDGNSVCVFGVQVAMEKGVRTPRMIAVSTKAISEQREK